MRGVKPNVVALFKLRSPPPETRAAAQAGVVA